MTLILDVIAQRLMSIQLLNLEETKKKNQSGLGVATRPLSSFCLCLMLLLKYTELSWGVQKD